MVTEQDKTLQALQMAIQMEIDGKEYYLKISQESSSELGKKLLTSLAAEEDFHRQKFEEIYDTIRSKKVWPETDFKSAKRKKPGTIFARAAEEISPNAKVHATELDAIQTAMNMENKTFDFYKNQSKSASYAAEKDFYETVAGEEREHHRSLLNYYEYLKDPAGWFVKSEHPSLDGG